MSDDQDIIPDLVEVRYKWTTTMDEHGSSMFLKAMAAEMDCAIEKCNTWMNRRLWVPLIELYRGAGRRWGKSKRARKRRFASWLNRRAAAHLSPMLNKAVRR